MKPKFAGGVVIPYLIVLCSINLFTSHLYTTIHFQGTQSHIVFMDQSSKVNLNTNVKAFCNKVVLVQNNNKSIDADEYEYNEATPFLCELVINNSNWVAAHGENLIDTSNWVAAHGENLIDTSNAIDYYGPIILQNQAGGTSAAFDITILENKMDFIDSWSVTIDHGPGNIDVTITSTSLIYNLWLSKHHKLIIDTATAGGDVTLDGSTHFIHFARETAETTGSDPMLIIAGGNKFELTNVVLKDFSPDYIDLQNNSSILFGNGTTIEITNNESITTNYTLSCHGKVIINCFGNELNLSHNVAALDVLPSSTLIIQNARITGLESNNLRCLAPDATLTLSNCSLVMSSDYSFTEGYLSINQEVIIAGLQTFAYQSPQPLTIHPNAQCKFDLGTTFSYDSGTTPANAGNNRFTMIDQTSKLFLNGCTLHVSTTGLQLTKGTIIVDHIVTVEGESNNSDGAITFGNGSANQDVTIEVMPGGNIEVVYGYINYKNIA